MLDTEEDTFRKFLNFLYGASIALEGLDLEEVCELLVIGDRYEVGTLRALCESELLARLGNTNVFTLLVMADQFSVTILKVSSGFKVLWSFNSLCSLPGSVFPLHRLQPRCYIYGG